MHFTFRNVNDAFHRMVKIFQDSSQGYGSVIHRSTSRVGDVLYIQEPFTITYTHPCERVLFNQARDANPFFHLYESLWMLAGRNDIAPLNYYSSGYAKQVQDGDSPVANGAYGFRWRRGIANYNAGHPERPKDFGTVDQLQLIIEQLKVKPDSRRCVLQMWNVEDDLLKIDTSKDVCCNTCAYFSLRTQVMARDPKWSDDKPGWVTPVKYLDMTVCNRSNDLIWGTLGANAVHFSFLQEYMAACIGVEVGVYNQFSNNQHVYVDRFEPDKWLNCLGRDYYKDPIPKHLLMPLVKDPETFDQECVEFVEKHSHNCLSEASTGYYEPFLCLVAKPMCLAFHYYKDKNYTMALNMAGCIESEDWRIAATNWLQKRKANYESKRAEIH